MNINDYFSTYKVYPVLFIGTGLSLRYYQDSFTWEALLAKIVDECSDNRELFLDMKSECMDNQGHVDYPKLGTLVEESFNSILKSDRNGKFGFINDEYYRKMEQGQCISRFKIYISQLFTNLHERPEKQDELEKLYRASKNVSSVITTNYDNLIENVLYFKPVIGNNILLSNPYGSVYKIHGSIEAPENIVITDEDYKNFDDKYNLIQAQVLSTFIYHPIIFLGYSLQDQNIRKLLKKIFSNIQPNSDLADKIRNNFLLINYQKDSENLELSDYDAALDNNGLTVRIKQLTTDKYGEIYDAISNLNLPVSAMDIRKVHDVIRDIHSGGKIKVKIVDDMSDMHNGDRVIAIGTNNTVFVSTKKKKDLIREYFELIHQKSGAIQSINGQSVNSTEYFPIYGFATVCTKINEIETLKQIERDRIDTMFSQMDSPTSSLTSITEILSDDNIFKTYKVNEILHAVKAKRIALDDLKSYLLDIPAEQRNTTDYRKLLCLYDIMEYGSYGNE